MLVYINVTPSIANAALALIQREDHLRCVRNAFVRAVLNQNPRTTKREALQAWHAFDEGGRRRIPLEVLNYSDLISGLAAR